MSQLGKITGLDTYQTAAEPWRGGLGAFNAAFGNSAEKFSAGRELDADGEIKANWKDRLFGHSTEELTEEAMKRKHKALRNDPRVDALLAEGKNVSVDTTRGQIQKQSSDLEALKTAQQLAAKSGYLKLAELTDPDAIYSGIKTKDTAQVEADRQKLRSEGQSDLAETRRYAADLRSDERKHEANLRSEDRRLQMERDSRQDLIRAQDRKDNLELRRDNMNLEYARLAQADRQKAADRKDKAIMMLMQGLGNLGTAFTI